MAADPTTTTTTMPVTVRIEAAEIKGRVSLVDSENESKQEDVDLFRHTPVRYLGYANEVGEAFRAQVHVRVVHLSYLVATGYVIADAAHKGQQAKELSSQHDPDGLGKVLTAVTDTLIWQGLASVVIPGFTINRICKASHFLLSRSTSLPLPTRKWMTTAVGLCCIPFIISPIDKSVDYLLNNTLRKWVKLRDIEAVVHHKRND